MLRRAGYRIGQVWHRAVDQVPDDLYEVQGLLGKSCWILFQSMPQGDKVHSLAVYRRLLAQGYQGDILVAALLHDVGKARKGLSLFHRTACVLLARFWPTALEWLGCSDKGWRRPFYTHLRHAELGADMCARCGCSERAVWLVRHHEREEIGAGVGDREILLAALRAADDRS